MGKKGIDVLLVRKSGPVQSMTFRTWWVYFLFLVLLLMLVAMGAGSFLLYVQQQALTKLADDTRMIMLRTERLEALVQEQETREVLAMQAETERAELEAEKAAQNKKGKPEEKTQAPEKSSAQPPKNETEKTETAKELPAETEKKTEPEPIEKKEQQEEARESTEPEQSQEPTISDVVAIRNIKPKVEGAQVEISFDVVNKAEASEPAMGYITAILRGERKGKTWVEAWPPMRLTPQGRPLNYRRGAPFSIQRYRRMKAKFELNEKHMTLLEMVVYDREGKLMMIRTEPQDLKPQSGVPSPDSQEKPRETVETSNGGDR